MERNRKNNLIVALDVDNIESAGYFARRMLPYTDYFKVGLEMITAVGCPKAVYYLQSFGAKNIFLDAKFHDIPNTVGKSVKAAADLGVAMISVHASSDSCESLRSAVDNKGNSLILGVIKLTSSKTERSNVYGSGKTEKNVFLDRIFKAKEAGVDGIICPAKYLKWVNKYKELNDLIRVTPGIRPEWASTDDHKKYSTPIEAIKNGSDFLVIGRPIISPPRDIGSPEKAIRLIVEEMNSVCNKEG